MRYPQPTFLTGREKNKLLGLTDKVVVEGMDIPELDIEEEQELGGFIQDEHVVVKEQPRSNVKQYAEPRILEDQTEEHSFYNYSFLERTSRTI
jgi:hypothetical protein